MIRYWRLDASMCVYHDGDSEWVGDGGGEGNGGRDGSRGAKGDLGTERRLERRRWP